MHVQYTAIPPALQAVRPLTQGIKNGTLITLSGGQAIAQLLL